MAQQESKKPTQAERLHLLENIIVHTQQVIYNSTKEQPIGAIYVLTLNVVYGKLDEMLLLASGDITRKEYDELLKAYPDD